MQDAIILYENGKAIGGEGHPTNASDITFDNTGTDLVSEEVESAIKEVNGKSAKSADLTSISESGTTASQAISAGTYFYLDGTLVRALTAIASGATFTLNTNYEVVSAGALNKAIPRLLFSTPTSMIKNSTVTIPNSTNYDYLLYTFTLDGKAVTIMEATTASFVIGAPYVISNSVGAIYAAFTKTGDTLKCTEGQYSGTSSSTTWVAISGNQLRLINVVGFNI